MGASIAMTANGSRLISSGSEWDKLLSLFLDKNLDDIYFDHRYLEIYKNSHCQLQGFVFQQGKETFFFTYLRRSVGIGREFEGWSDFETAYGYGGPLSTTLAPAFLKLAWKTFEQMAGREKLLAGFIRFHPLLQTERFAKYGPVMINLEKVTVRLSLNQSPEDVWKNYPRDNKDKIKKSKRLGVVVAPAPGRQALNVFANLYNTRMEELQAEKKYFFGETFFESLCNLGEKNYRLYFARYKDKVVGGALLLLSRRFVHYHLSATPNKYQSLAPNNLLRHEIISDFLKGPYSDIHFGGGTTSSQHDTLLQFKKRFSKQEALYYIGHCIFNQEVYSSVVKRWKSLNPNKVQKYENLVLCYRY